MIAIVVAAFTAVGLLLAVLHGIEAAHLRLGALDSPEAAPLLRRLDGHARRLGADAAAAHWQMMGVLEAADGMLLLIAAAAGGEMSPGRGLTRLAGAPGDPTRADDQREPTVKAGVSPSFSPFPSPASSDVVPI